MKSFAVHKRIGWQGSISRRTARVMQLFGLDRYDLQQRVFDCTCHLQIGPGQICLITGPSGSGKTMLLRELYNLAKPQERLELSEIPLETGRSVIDCMEGTLPEALRCLCRAGLSDVFALLSSPSKLSEGQQYRYRLARALRSGRPTLFADEFCSSLDRPGAGILAFQIHRAIRQSGQIFFAASCRENLSADLRPDMIVRKDLTGRTEVIETRRNLRQVC